MYETIVMLVFLLAIPLAGMAIVWSDGKETLLLGIAVFLIAIGCWMNTRLTVAMPTQTAYTVPAATTSCLFHKTKETVMPGDEEEESTKGFIEKAKENIKAEFAKLEADLKNLLPTEHHDAVSSQVSAAQAAALGHVGDIPPPTIADAAPQARKIASGDAVDADGNPAGVRAPA